MLFWLLSVIRSFTTKEKKQTLVCFRIRNVLENFYSRTTELESSASSVAENSFVFSDHRPFSNPLILEQAPVLGFSRTTMVSEGSKLSFSIRLLTFN